MRSAPMRRSQIRGSSTRAVAFALFVCAGFAAGRVLAQGAAGTGCPADCDGLEGVTVDEIVTAVNIALGVAPVENCSNADVDGNGEVTVEEIVQAVNAALTGCSEPATPTSTVPPPATASPTETPTVFVPTPVDTPTMTPTPTVTETPTITDTPTVSPTPSPSFTPGPSAPEVARRVVASVHGSTSVFLVFPRLLTAIEEFIGNRVGGISGVGNVAFTCSQGGQGTVACDQDLTPPTFGPPLFTLDFDNCVIPGANGAMLDFDGRLTAAGEVGDSCSSLPLLLSVETPSLNIEERGATGTIIGDFTRFSATVDLSLGGSEQCTSDYGSFQPVGTVSAVWKSPSGATLSSSRVRFIEESLVEVQVDEFGDRCSPSLYTVWVDGDTELTTDGRTLSGTFSSYSVSNEVSSGANRLDIEGGLIADCLGGEVNLRASEPMLIPSGQVCASAGRYFVDHAATTDAVDYRQTGIEIDRRNDGTVDDRFNTCVDPALFVCTTN